jgi:hypothetical protein
LLRVHYEAPGKLGKDCICCLISWRAYLTVVFEKKFHLLWWCI